MSVTDEQVLKMTQREVQALKRKIMELHARGYDVSDVLPPLREIEAALRLSPYFEEARA